MACKTETKEIGGIEYSVTQWPAEKALTMKFKLGKIISPVFAALATGQNDETKAVESLSAAITELFASAEPEEIVSLIKTCIVGVAREGTKITDTSFTQLFSGDALSDIYPILFFVLSVNYGNFIKGQLKETLLNKAAAHGLT